MGAARSFSVGGHAGLQPNIKVSEDGDIEVSIVDSPPSHPVVAFVREYPALLVFGALLVIYLVVKLRSNRSKLTLRAGSSASRPKPTLGSSQTTDTERGAQVR